MEQDFANFTAGIIFDPETGRKFESLHGGLTSEDCQNVGRVAADVWRLDKMVDWFEAAVARYVLGCANSSRSRGCVNFAFIT